MRRREFLRVVLRSAAVSPVAAAHSRCSPSRKSPPNFILVLVDDLGWRDVGFMGSRFYETPNIDRLARRGTTFTQAYAAAAVCSPTRASIMTGRYPARLGITDWIRARRDGAVLGPERKNPTGYDSDPGFRLETPRNAHFMELEEVTIAEVLKSGGYATGHVGKWHLGPDEFLPPGQGFDLNRGGADIGHTENYFDPYLNAGAPISSLPPRKTGEYMSDREADEAEQFIREHRDRPFFLNLCPYAVHLPLQAKPEDTAHFEDKPAVDDQKNAVYAAMIKSVDDTVGRVLDTLDELGLAERTVVFFFSDNGGLHTVTSNAPLRLGKGYPYEGGTREALVISRPGTVPANVRAETPVMSIDFFPTIARMAGLGLPRDRVIDGRDLMPLLGGRGRFAERDVFWHYPHYWWGDRVRPWSSVRSGDWKLIRFWEDGREELFDLRVDIGETRDLAGVSPEKARELSAKLDAWLAETRAKLPRRNPLFGSKGG